MKLPELEKQLPIHRDNGNHSSTFDIFPGLRLNQTSLIDKILIDRVSVY